MRILSLVVDLEKKRGIYMSDGSMATVCAVMENVDLRVKDGH